MITELSLIRAAPLQMGGVQGFMSTRGGGVSSGLYDDPQSEGGLNLGIHVNDDPGAVLTNRDRLTQMLPSAPLWLDQVHGNTVFHAFGHLSPAPPTADASVTDQAGLVLAILTADCLPILLADPRARVIGAVHGGWRGLAAGVLVNAISKMQSLGAHPAQIRAWFGAAIGSTCFEVGAEVRQIFMQIDPAFAESFKPHPINRDKWLGDLVGIASQQLALAGVGQCFSSGYCTVSDPRFYSYRRDGVTGRMASVIWLA